MHLHPHPRSRPLHAPRLRTRPLRAARVLRIFSAEKTTRRGLARRGKNRRGTSGRGHGSSLCSFVVASLHDGASSILSTHALSMIFRHTRLTFSSHSCSPLPLPAFPVLPSLLCPPCLPYPSLPCLISLPSPSPRLHTRCHLLLSVLPALPALSAGGGQATGGAHLPSQHYPLFRFLQNRPHHQQQQQQQQ